MNESKQVEQRQSQKKVERVHLSNLRSNSSAGLGKEEQKHP